MAPVWTLVEDLRIGEAQGQTFTDIRGVAATKNGNIFVLDFKPQSIRLYDARGVFIKQVARDGAGPGEIRNANGLAVGDNDIVWANDPSNSRFSLYKSDGSFHKQVVVPISRFGYIWISPVDARGRVMDPVSVGEGPNRRRVMRFVDEAGNTDTVTPAMCRPEKPLPDPPFLTFVNATERRNSELPFLPSGRIGYTATGHAWCTASDSYRLFRGRIGDSLPPEVVNIRVTPVPVSDAERTRELHRIDSISRNYGKLTAGDPSLIPRTKPVIAALHVDPAGRAWVRLTETAEAAPAFDVFDLNGKPVARIVSRGKVDMLRTWITGSHLYTVVADEDDVPSVVRYRIVK